MSAPTQQSLGHGSFRTEAAPSFHEWFTTRTPAWWLDCFLLVGIAVRLFRFLMGNPLWGDEGMLMLNLVHRPWWKILDPLGMGQVAPPLFVAGEWAMLHGVGPSVYSLRLLPLLASLAALVLFRRLVILWLKPAPAAVAMGLLSVANWPIGMGSLMKPYSWDLLGALLLLVPTSRFLQQPHQSRWLWILAGASPVVLWGSFPSVFISSAVSLALLIRVGQHPTASNIIGYLAWSISWLASFGICHEFVIARTVPETMLGMQAYWKAAFPPSEFFRLLWWFFEAHTGQMLAYPLGSSNGGSLATTAAVVVGLLEWKRDRQWMPLILFGTPFLLGLLVSIAGRYPYGGSGRLTQHVAPLICMAAGIGFSRWTEHPRWKGRGLAWMGGLLLMIGAGSCARAAVRPYRDIDEVWFRDFFHGPFASVRKDDLVLVNRDPQSPDTTIYLRWYLWPYESQVAFAPDLIPRRLRETTGNVWILTWDCYLQDEWVSLQAQPSADASRRLVRVECPDRTLQENITYVLPKQGNMGAMHVLHFERWAIPGKEALPKNIAVWP